MHNLLCGRFCCNPLNAHYKVKIMTKPSIEIVGVWPALVVGVGPGLVAFGPGLFAVRPGLVRVRHGHLEIDF